MAIPAELLPRLQTWWASLEASTQAIFEAIYMEAPAAVSNAVSGGQWVADSPEPGLAAQLATDNAMLGENIPILTTSELPTVTPFHAGIGQQVTISWSEQNTSRADLGAYVTDIYVSDAASETVASGRLPGDGVKAGGTAQRTWQFDGAKSNGRHYVMIYMNAEGSDPGSGVPGEQGYRYAASAQFDVGGGDDAATEQNWQVWGTVVSAFSAAAAGYSDADFNQQATEGVNWLAGIDTLDAANQAAVEKLGGTVAAREGRAPFIGITPGDSWDADQKSVLAERQAQWEDKHTTVLGLVAQPGTPDDQAYVARLVAAMQALAEV